MLTVISGGQTGIDRLALDLAIELKIDHGGWCPKGRRSEDGTIPIDYQLQETDSRNYAQRTERNIVESDGTLILFGETLSGGTELTAKIARRLNRPSLAIGVKKLNEAALVCAETECLKWLIDHQISVLNVAGPRLSSAPNLPDLFNPFLKSVLQQFSEALQLRQK